MKRLLPLLALVAAPAFAQSSELYGHFGGDIPVLRADGNTYTGVAANFGLAFFERQIAGRPFALHFGGQLGGGAGSEGIMYLTSIDLGAGLQVVNGPVPVAVIVGAGGVNFLAESGDYKAEGVMVEGRSRVGPLRLQARVIPSGAGHYGVTAFYQVPDAVPLIGRFQLGGTLQKTGKAAGVVFQFQAHL